MISRNKKKSRELLNLKSGDYFLFDLNKQINNSIPRIAILGLGSCIALILCDYKNKICGMSHILLPKNNSPTLSQVKFMPHKYGNISVKTLYNELLKKGAQKMNIKAIIIGGSTIYNDINNRIGQENIESVKKALIDHEIKIKKEDVGGSKGRSIIFDPIDFSLMIKKGSMWRKIQ